MLTVVTMQVSAESNSPGLGASKAACASADAADGDAEAVSFTGHSQPAKAVHIIKLKNKAIILLFTILPLFETVDSGQQIFLGILGRVIQNFL